MLINLTPHPINIYQGDSLVQTLEPSGAVARVSSTQQPQGDIDGFPLVKNTFGEVTGLPEANPGTWLVVSGLVLTALNGARPDVVGPDTSPNGVVRDPEGKIIGVRGFQQ